jgi:7-cyano-7-deazaguanine reductase
MNPRYIEVRGVFTPRGGIAIYPFANYGDDEHRELMNQRLSAALNFSMQ